MTAWNVLWTLIVFFVVEGDKYHILICGKTLKCQEEIRNHIQTPGLKEVSLEECDVIMVLCPVVSRAGTDIEAALKKLNGGNILLYVDMNVIRPDVDQSVVTH